MRTHLFAASALLAFLAVAAHADDAPKAPRVVVVGVDAKTLEALGPWGGRYRPHHPKLIEELNKAGVRGIAFDVYLPENPDFADATAAIAKAAKASTAPVVIARHQDEANAAVLTRAKVTEGNVMVTRALDVKSGPDGLEATVLDMALPADVLGLRPLGVELAIRANVLTAAEADKLAETLTVGYEAGKPVTLKGFKPESGDAKSVTTVSYVDVLEGRVDPKLLEGALVIIGMTDGQNDMHAHPKSGDEIPGVYFHAFMLERAVRVAQANLAAKANTAGAATRPTTVKEPSRTQGLIGGLKR